MFDTFVEELVKVTSSVRVNLARVGIVVAALVLTGLAFWYVPVVMPLLFSIFVVGAYFAIKFLGVEYEYAFTNGDFDVDKILGKRRRKRVASFETKAVKLMAPYTPEYESDATAFNIDYTYDFSSGPSAAGRWFMVFEDKAGKLCFMVIQPSEKMRDALKGYLRGRMKGQ